MKRFALKCDVISPVHIGTGKEIDPLSYVIKEGRLHHISFGRLACALDNKERDHFEALIDRGDLVEIRRFTADAMVKYGEVLYTIETAPDVEALYNAKLDDIGNQLIINPFIRTGLCPVIPGSSIKGALRTAIVSELARRKRLPRPGDYRAECEFEFKALGARDARDDPFRCLKVRDAHLKADDTIVRRVVNVSKKKGGPLRENNIQIICEMTHSSLTGKEVVFHTGLLIDDKLAATGFTAKTFSIGDIVECCRAFYDNKVKKEHDKFYRGSEVEEFSERLIKTLDTLGKDEFLLRVGRFSGVESVTLDIYRNPRPPGRKTTWGTSRNLAEGLYPMGWIKATISPVGS